MADKKWVYLFRQGDASMRNLLGGKGANLAEMASIGLPVPPGFTITTEACNAYTDLGNKFPEGMWAQVLDAMHDVEEQTGKKFGDPGNPLLVSVRSGARVSMPGMMDTVLNLGLNDETLKGVAKATGNDRFAYDSYRRFIQMFSRIVRRTDAEPFEHILDKYKEQTEGKQDTDLTTAQLKDIVQEFKAYFKKQTGEDFPTDPYEQLRQAIAAVFGSWMGRRAVDYRNFHKLPHNWGTAVNVQTMVFGNMGQDSGTGVAFTRDPATGDKQLYGEYLENAQGEDVVAGIRTPKKIAQLHNDMPAIYDQFAEVAQTLEKHYRDMQDMEFTIENGTLYMLQTRTGKRTAAAAAKAAVDMVHEGLISKDEAIMRLEPDQVNQLLLPSFDLSAKEAAGDRLLAKGLNASPGAAVGIVALDADIAEEWGLEGKNVILVRPETSPDDVHGMLRSKGILTQHGGATSHAAVVARGLGLPCVAGCEAIRVNMNDRVFNADGQTIREGEVISLDGTTGEVFKGEIATIETEYSEQANLVELLGWADEARRMGVRANADYPADATRAREFGAQGIGLCRTEHMFFEEERLPIVQKMILSETDEERQGYLDQLLPFQRGDFEGIFRAMDGLPVIIRLIDPPLHEFLPSHEDLLVEITRMECEGGDEKELAEKRRLLSAVGAMREANPMLGLRGCRLGLIVPGIVEMQTRAILEAAANVTKEGVETHVEIMIPLISHVNELIETRNRLEKVADQVTKEQGAEVDYMFGTMIEIPRACLTADQIAPYAEFFSFGTNDLTQTTFGISRDDAEGKFLLQYVEDKILPENPFQVLDREGVGQLVRMATEKGRAARPGLEVGICGEHGGDPSSIEFCHMVGLDYVSCSPFRVPIARLAAAQSAIKERLTTVKDV